MRTIHTALLASALELTNKVPILPLRFVTCLNLHHANWLNFTFFVDILTNRDGIEREESLGGCSWVLEFSF